MTLDINKMKALPYDELHSLYREFLRSKNIPKPTINTAYTDTFYLWKKGSKDLFWNAVADTDFENVAKNELIKAFLRTRPVIQNHLLMATCLI